MHVAQSFDRLRHRRVASQILESKTAEAADAEVARLEAVQVASHVELDALQMSTVEATESILDAMSELRCAWRKRLRSGAVAALACTLDVLELEVDADGAETRKRRHHDHAQGACFPAGASACVKAR